MTKLKVDMRSREVMKSLQEANRISKKVHDGNLSKEARKINYFLLEKLQDTLLALFTKNPPSAPAPKETASPVPLSVSPFSKVVLSKLREDLACPICFENLKETSIVSCDNDHIFCGPCLTTFMKKDEAQGCPVCKKQVCPYEIVMKKLTKTVKLFHLLHR